MDDETRPALRVAMIGYAFMGAAHSQGWRNAPRFFDLPITPELSVLVGRDKKAVEVAGHRFGFADTDTDWRRVVERPDVDLVDICTPGDTHAEIAIAALQAGKHVLCEKPLANTVAEAEQMAAAAAVAPRGARAMVGFTYRRVPAVQLAREVVRSGRIGEVRQVRAQYLQDWIVDADFPLVWRLQKERAGSGALGDIGAHLIDTAQFILGQQITSVSGTLRTFVQQRPLQESTGHGLGAAGGTETGPVTVDDAATFSASFDGGAFGVFEATRFATGRKNAMRIEVSGSRGAVAFDLEDMNVLQILETDGPDSGFRRVVVTEPEHPYISSWWPAGHLIGWEHSFTHQVVDLVTALAADRAPEPGFADGLQVQQVLQAVETSAAARSIVTDVPTH